MSTNVFPPLTLHTWQPTLTTLQTYAKLIGKIRRALTPRQKHWFHVSLRVSAVGLTTTVIPAGNKTFEMVLDLTGHKLIIATSKGNHWETPLYGQSPLQFKNETLDVLELIGVEPDIDHSLFENDLPSDYDPAAVERYWQALSQIDALFKQFKSELREETSPVQLWPHHIDLAMLWFSGRLVPDQDPNDEEYADEQMNFGFTPGDETIPEAYFYITAYPTPNGLTDTPLPGDAYWLTEGFTGAILPYKSLVTAADPGETLLTYLRAVQKAGAGLMA